MTLRVAGSKDELLSFDRQLERIRAVIARLESFEIRVHPSSRLREYEKHLEWATNEAGPMVTRETADRLAFDLREIDEVSVEVADTRHRLSWLSSARVIARHPEVGSRCGVFTDELL